MKTRTALALSGLAVLLFLGACQDTVTEPRLAEESTEERGLSIAGERRCTGRLSGTFDNVVVPQGATCVLVDSKIRGNIKALQNARLFMDNDIVGGTVEGDKASSVQIFFSTVHGNIKIVEAHDPFFISALVAATILPNGNIQIEKGRFPLGDWTVVSNTLEKGNIQVVENGSEFSSVVAANDVAGDVQVFKNFGPQSKVVGLNIIDENLQCKENTEPFISERNDVGGNAEDQCAASETTSTSDSASEPDLSEFPVRKQTD